MRNLFSVSAATRVATFSAGLGESGRSERGRGSPSGRAEDETTIHERLPPVIKTQ
jgi:hypothetical protein